jgi:hypothetical protein
MQSTPGTEPSVECWDAHNASTMRWSLGKLRSQRLGQGTHGAGTKWASYATTRLWKHICELARLPVATACNAMRRPRGRVDQSSWRRVFGHA